MRNDKWDDNDGIIKTNLNVLDVAYCGMCKEKMNVHRNILDPMHMTPRGIEGGSNDDVFSCPNYSEKWHRQAVVLKERIKKETSFKIIKMLQEEIEEIIQAKKPTVNNI